MMDQLKLGFKKAQIEQVRDAHEFWRRSNSELCRNVPKSPEYVWIAILTWLENKQILFLDLNKLQLL